MLKSAKTKKVNKQKTLLFPRKALGNKRVKLALISRSTLSDRHVGPPEVKRGVLLQTPPFSRSNGIFCLFLKRVLEQNGAKFGEKGGVLEAKTKKVAKMEKVKILGFCSQKNDFFQKKKGRPYPTPRAYSR